MSFHPGGNQPPNAGRGGQGMAPTQAPQELLRRQSRHPGMGTDAQGFDSVDSWIQFDNDELKKPMPLASTSSATRATASAGLLGLDDIVDDSAVDHALSDDEEAFSLEFADRFSRIDSLTVPELSPMDNLPSGPFRWDAPQVAAPRPGSLVFVQSATLSEAEQRRLMAIALGQGASQGPWGSGLDSLPAVGQATAMAPHPRPTPPQQKPAAKPPSSSSAQAQGDKAVADDGSGKPKNTERAAHNDIERKYRTNLKDKIAELRDAVPALSIAGGEGEQGGSAPKVSKGTVLTKATEYIRHLERRNRAVTQQHQELSRRLQAFEQMLTPTARASFRGPPNPRRSVVDS